MQNQPFLPPCPKVRQSKKYILEYRCGGEVIVSRRCMVCADLFKSVISNDQRKIASPGIAYPVKEPFILKCYVVERTDKEGSQWSSVCADSIKHAEENIRVCDL